VEHGKGWKERIDVQKKDNTDNEARKMGKKGSKTAVLTSSQFNQPRDKGAF
jgi:hypothetical protein